MEEKQYTLLRVFRSEEDAQFFVDILGDTDVDFRLEKPQKTSDNIVTDSFSSGSDALHNDFFLMVNVDDVEKAHQ
ncbi:MAG: hypothetical protein HUK15_04605, partial [Bacteroidales bacterium]|nr:hypothetical protein [Bacteroidales bacterium]